MMKILFSLVSGVFGISSGAKASSAENGETLAPQGSAVMPTGQDIHDIYGPIILPEPINWLLIGIAALAIAAIIILFFFLKKNRNGQAVPVIQPHIPALAELDQARVLLKKGESLLYLQKISEIMRDYIEARFAIRSTRQTTAEFLSTLHNQPDALLMPHTATLKKFLELCDLAKYAHQPSNRETMENMERSVRLFIEETVEKEEV